MMERLLVCHHGRLAGPGVFHARNLGNDFWLFTVSGVTVGADSSHRFRILIEQVRSQRRRAIRRIRSLVQWHLGSLSRRLRRVMTIDAGDWLAEIGAAILCSMLR